MSPGQIVEVSPDIQSNTTVAEIPMVANVTNINSSKQFLTYTDSGHGFSIKYPIDWDNHSIETNYPDLVGSFTPNTNSTPFLTIFLKKLPQGLTMEQIGAREVELLEKGHGLTILRSGVDTRSNNTTYSIETSGKDQISSSGTLIKSGILTFNIR